MQTYGRRVENDTWSPENTDAKFPQPRAGGESFTDYKEYMNYTKGNMVAVRILHYLILSRKNGWVNWCQ